MESRCSGNIFMKILRKMLRSIQFLSHKSVSLLVPKKLWSTVRSIFRNPTCTSTSIAFQRMTWRSSNILIHLWVIPNPEYIVYKVFLTFIWISLLCYRSSTDVVKKSLKLVPLDYFNTPKVEIYPNKIQKP